MSLIFRDTKLAELEHHEVDENFRYLDQKSNLYEVGHVYRNSVIRIYNGHLYLLSSAVTFPFTATNFTTELAAGNWLLLGSSSSYKGELNLTTPVLINGVGTVGDYYKVTEAGNYDFGAGVIEFKVGDFVFYDGTVYGHYIDNNQLFSSSYVKKSFSSTSEYNGVGSNVIIPFNPNGYSEIRLINSGLVSISGFDLSLMTGPNAEFPYQGKEIMVWNRTGGNVTLNHEDFATADYPMFLRAETNLVLPDNHILTFKYDAGGLQEKDKSFFSVDEIIGLASVLASKANLVAGKIPASELPSYVDDVLEFANLAAFPATGETGKIYLALDTNLTYRWSGSTYVDLNSSKLNKVSTVDVQKVYVKNADGTQSMKPTSEFQPVGDYITVNTTQTVTGNKTFNDVGLIKKLQTNVYPNQSGGNFTIGGSGGYDFFDFYSFDGTDQDSFGIVKIYSKPEEGNFINHISLDNENASYLNVNYFDLSLINLYAGQRTSLYVDGQNGKIKIEGTQNRIANLGTSLITGTKNFEFPNNSGTLALLSDLSEFTTPSEVATQITTAINSNKTSFTHNILASDWTLVSGKYEAIISNAGILANSFVDVIPSNDYVDIVRNAQIYPSVLISEGSVKVYSKFLPSDTITVTININ